MVRKASMAALGLSAVAFFFAWPYILVRLADDYGLNRRYEKSIEAYTSAIRTGRLDWETLASAYAGRAEDRLHLAQALGEEDSAFMIALEDYSEAIRLNPDGENYYSGRGEVYGILGAYSEAFEDFDRRRALEGARPMWSLIGRGGLHRQLGEYDLAIQSFEEVIDAWAPEGLMPPNYHLALTYMKMGRFEEALAALDAGIKAQKDFAFAFIMRGCVKANLGRYDEAVADYERGMELKELYPTNPDRTYPSDEFDDAVFAGELSYLRDLASGRTEPDAKRLAAFGQKGWWMLRYQVRRERSAVLDEPR